MDTNGDGTLSLEELTRGLKQSNVRLDMQTLQQLDLDGSGGVDYSEFLAATLDQSRYLKEDICRRAFNVCHLDKNHDGKIDFDELWSCCSTSKMVRRAEPSV